MKARIVLSMFILCTLITACGSESPPVTPKASAVVGVDGGLDGGSDQGIGTSPSEEDHGIGTSPSLDDDPTK